MPSIITHGFMIPYEYGRETGLSVQAIKHHDFAALEVIPKVQNTNCRSCLPNLASSHARSSRSRLDMDDIRTPLPNSTTSWHLRPRLNDASLVQGYARRSTIRSLASTRRFCVCRFGARDKERGWNRLSGCILVILSYKGVQSGNDGFPNSTSWHFACPRNRPIHLPEMGHLTIHLALQPCISESSTALCQSPRAYFDPLDIPQPCRGDFMSRMSSTCPPKRVTYAFSKLDGGRMTGGSGKREQLKESTAHQEKGAKIYILLGGSTRANPERTLPNWSHSDCLFSILYNTEFAIAPTSIEAGLYEDQTLRWPPTGCVNCQQDTRLDGLDGGI